MKEFSQKPVTSTLMVAECESDLSLAVLKCQLDKLSFEIFRIDLKQSKSSKSDIIAGYSQHPNKIRIEESPGEEVVLGWYWESRAIRGFVLGK